ncbi:MAG: sigma-54 dependent transcriptional regulator [candidate division WOR-3 bacterium]
MLKIAVVEDDRSERWILTDFLSKKGYLTFDFEKGEDFVDFFNTNSVDLVITDLRLPGINGIDLVKEIKKRKPQCEAIVMTAYGNVESAVAAMKSGAYDYLQKPINLEELLFKIKRIEEKLNLERRLELAESDIKYSKGVIIAESTRMKEAIQLALQVAQSQISVLITGESGTGKEVLARFIHENSGRNGSFVAVSCAAIPETLLEAELFGYERGAFTGAVDEKPGKMELADGGTLFLDEIGDMPLSLQVKLLRVLEDREVTRLGSIKPRKVNVRFIFATNKNLEDMVKNGTFRQDLYYRINVFNINLRPLRERVEDIIPLAYYFLKKFSRELHKDIRGFTEDAISLLTMYSWPGNVRELQNVVERACVLCNGEYITGDLIFLPERKVIDSLRLEDIEREHIRKVLEITGWNISKASEILGIHRNTLSQKIRYYGLKKGD